MKQLVQYHMRDGSDIVIEVEETELEASYDLSPASLPGDVAEKAKEGLLQAKDAFEEAFSKLTPALEHITSTLRRLQPDELKMDFGVKFTFRAGAIIAATAAEANLNVTLTWNKADDTSKP